MRQQQKRQGNKRGTAERPERETNTPVWSVLAQSVKQTKCARCSPFPWARSPNCMASLSTTFGPVTAAGRTTLPSVPRRITPAYHVIDAVHGLTKVSGLEANVGVRLQQRVIVDPPRRHVGVEVMANHNGRVCRRPLRLDQHRRGRARQRGGIPVGGPIESGRGGLRHGGWHHVIGRRGGHREWSGEVARVDEWKCRRTDVRMV